MASLMFLSACQGSDPQPSHTDAQDPGELNGGSDVPVTDIEVGVDVVVDPVDLISGDDVEFVDIIDSLDVLDVIDVNDLIDINDANESDADLGDTLPSVDAQDAEIAEPDPGCNVEPSLSSISSKYFAVGCVACHGARADGGLDLRGDGLHGRLVGVLAANRTARDRGKLLVVGGDPGNSFLLQKVTGDHARDEGRLMPDRATEPVDPGCWIFMLRKWIADGALDN